MPPAPTDGGNETTEPPSRQRSLRLPAWLMGLVKSHLNLRDQEIVPTNGNSNSEQQQAIMRQNIMELHDRHVSDVMRPRADIVAVELNTPLAELLKIIVANPYSRLPVYREELDDILGIIHIKDILDSMVNEAKFDLGRLIRATKFVVPSMPVLDLLLQMRQTRMQMAMVIDEYGGIDGLVTIEDLLEQIVGDIEDERDLAAPQMMELSQGVWISDARLSLRDFEKTVGSVLQEEEQEESDTLGGLIVYLADRVPRRGETITHDAGFAFDILEADNRRVKRVRIRKVEPQPTGE
ncbi:MAG TPA: magnesium/cobalt efflux protein [Rhodospirillaceae bacterium]|nr:magnesium/cobalt efflux protein [Rhodospirillaceae bacterium]